MKNTAVLCNELVRFEERAAEIYLTLARRFAATPDLSWLWLAMGMEEKQHATVLDFLQCDPALMAQLPDTRTIRRLSVRLSELEYRARQEELSIDEAFLIAAELASSELGMIYARVAQAIRGTDYVLRKKIETLVPHHMETLLRSAPRFGVSGATMSRLARMNDVKASA
jgi:hypothetical protein